MEAQAFVERDIDKLIDTGVSFIPTDSIIYRMIAELRELRTREDSDWQKGPPNLIEANYGYDKYGGNCHMVPNHALIILALLYGDDDFQKTMMIVNTCGWDTDCNSGNVGCIMGIKNGLAGLETGPDWRGPVADRMFLPTADGGSAITDALTEDATRSSTWPAPCAGWSQSHPKNGARFHFSLPGAVQGFREEDSILQGNADAGKRSPAGNGAAGAGSALSQHGDRARGARGADTFIPPSFAHSDLHYALLASPTLYPGQKVRARLAADPSNEQPVQASIYIRRYGPGDELVMEHGPR